jgi:hypothetical protein
MQSLKKLAMKVALPVMGLVSYASATCDSSNITCMLQPVMDLLDVMPDVIAKLSPIVIALAILAAVVAAIGAIAAVFVILPYIVKKVGAKVGGAI